MEKKIAIIGGSGMATFAVTKALEEAGKDVVVVTPENKGQILLAEREPYIINRLSPLMAINEGKIKVIDTVTGEIFEFKNTKDAGLLKMFSTCAITQCLKTGNKTRITKISKYKNPCIIQRI